MIKKILIGYSFATVSIVILVSLGFMYIFKTSFDEQLIYSNNQTIGYLTKYINQNIVVPIGQTYNEITYPLSTNSELLRVLNDIYDDDPIQLKKSYDYLRSIISKNSELLDSIHIYNKRHNLIISSSMGIKYLDSYQTQPDWISRARESTENSFVINNAASVPFTEAFDNILNYICYYPVNTNYETGGNCISINIKTSFINSLLNNTGIGDTIETLIINADNTVIAQSNRGQDFNSSPRLFEDISRLLKQGDEAKYFDTAINGNPVVVSFSDIPRIGFIVAVIADKSIFYKSSNDVLKLLAIILTLVIAIGTFLLRAMTAKIYNPVKSIMQTIDDKENDTLFKNEYEIIDTALKRLAADVKVLEETMERNRPLIKSNFVLALINGTINLPEEYADHTDMMNLALDYKYFNLVIIKLPQEIIDCLNIKNASFLRMQLIAQMEHFSTSDMKILASEITPYSIAAIINCSQQDDHSVEIMMDEINSYLFSNFHMTITSFVGEWVSSPLKIKSTYSDIVSYESYTYFLPRHRLLKASNLKGRTTPTPEQIKVLTDSFCNAVRSGDTVAVIAELDSLVKLSSENTYDYNGLNQIIFAFLNSVKAHMNELNIKSSEIIDSDLLECFNSISNILEFKEWLTDIIEKVNNIQGGSRNNLIEDIKSYISDNLESISLTSIAEEVNLTPVYLSRIFKSKTGEKLIDYITTSKMTKAKELLLDTDLTIAEVGKSVGVYTPHYFIDLFKKTYGVTPKVYRKLHGQR